MPRVIGSQRLSIMGTIKGEKDVNLSFEMNGAIKEFLVEEGAFVKKGGIIAKLYSEEAELKYEYSKAKHEEALVNYKLAEKNFENIEKLFEAKEGRGNPIIIDQNDNPHICYVIGEKIIHLYYDNGWVNEEVDNHPSISSISFFSALSLAKDENNNLHLSYYNHINHDLEYSTNLKITNSPFKPI